MRRTGELAVAVVTVSAILLLGGLATVTQIAPRMDWSATAKPGAIETRLANEVRERWIGLHAPNQRNPIEATPANLESGRREYDEHCAACHGRDGEGRNNFQADFYPPIPRLIGDTQEMSDAEIYFVIANGVALSAMPAFGRRHEPTEIWKMVLWVRHLPHLTEEERKGIVRERSQKERLHREVMIQGAREEKTTDE